MKFPDDEVSRDVYTHAQDVFAKALFERDNGHGSWDKLATEIKSWNRQAYGVIVEADEDVEMAEAEAEAEALEQESDDSSDGSYLANPTDLLVSRCVCAKILYLARTDPWSGVFGFLQMDPLRVTKKTKMLKGFVEKKGRPNLV